MEALKLEWMSWYDKFKMLLHRWTKRDKAPTVGEEQAPGASSPEPGEQTRTVGVFPHSRRGF